VTVASIAMATAEWQALGPHVAWLLLPGPILGLVALRPIVVEPALPPEPR
jgi:hypothetical protein